MIIATCVGWSKQAGQGKAGKAEKRLCPQDPAAAAAIAAHVAQGVDCKCKV